MPDFRRGAQAIEESASRKGGSFRPFVPTIAWRDDKEQKHILFLTPISECPTVDYYEWIPVGKGEKSNGDTYVKYEQFVSRKDPAIGESYDELADRLGVTAKERTIGVAVELDPVTEKDDAGRTKVTGFTVATDSYTRKNEDGSEEEVTQPLIGIVAQSAQNFFGWLSSYDASQGPIEQTPMSVTRRGKDANTTYDFIPMENRAVDLSDLIEFIDGVSYLREVLPDVLGFIEEAQTDEDAAAVIAGVLLKFRLEELADKERYDTLVGPIEEIVDKYAKRKPAAAKKTRPPRAKRASKSDAPAPEPDPGDAKQDAPAATSRVDRFAKLRAQVETKSAA